jgi:hypothetical protein
MLDGFRICFDLYRIFACVLFFNYVAVWLIISFHIFWVIYHPTVFSSPSGLFKVEYFTTDFC